MSLNPSIGLLYTVATLTTFVGLAAVLTDRMKHRAAGWVAMIAGLTPWMTWLMYLPWRPGTMLALAGMVASIPLFILALLVCASANKTPNQRAVLAILLGGILSGITFFLAAAGLVAQME